MSELQVVRSAAPDCMVTRDSRGELVMCPHSQGFPGVLWQVGVMAAINKLSDSDRANFCKVTGLNADVELAQFADRFAETLLEAQRLTAEHPELAQLVPADMVKQLATLKQSPSTPPVDLATARFVLNLMFNTDGVSQAKNTPKPVGKIVRVSDGAMTCYAVVETPMGDPIWISIARSGIVVKRSSVGIFGQVIFRGSPEETAIKTQELYESFGDINLPTSVSHPVLRVWIQAAICMRDAAHFVRVVN